MLHLMQLKRFSDNLISLSSAYIRPLSISLVRERWDLLPQNVPVYVVSYRSLGVGVHILEMMPGIKVSDVCISNWKRISPQSFKPYAKGVGGYMNSTLAKIDAVKEWL